MNAWGLAVEGDVDAAIAIAILRHCGQECSRLVIAGGTSKLDPKIRGYLAAARRAPWLILRDLDDGECAPSLIRSLAKEADPAALRICVRSAEAWLLADRESAASWLRVATSKMPRDVESLPHPKQELINLARSSKSRDIRADIVPADGSTARQGKGYVDQVRAYCQTSWRPKVAAAVCDSLRRCIAFVRASASR